MNLSHFVLQLDNGFQLRLYHGPEGFMIEHTPTPSLGGPHKGETYQVKHEDMKALDEWLRSRIWLPQPEPKKHRFMP